jgi:hypothetical protein
MKNIFWSRKILFRFHESIFFNFRRNIFFKSYKKFKNIMLFSYYIKFDPQFFFIVIYFVLNHFLIFFNFIQ